MNTKMCLHRISEAPYFALSKVCFGSFIVPEGSIGCLVKTSNKLRLVDPYWVGHVDDEKMLKFGSLLINFFNKDIKMTASDFKDKLFDIFKLNS